jgi:AcrR family transcriptional regulator
VVVPTDDRPTAPTGPAGLRERKKRLTRQRLSDTATVMFLERGFDAVRVAEIAAACGVSEKTVFNYFPSKESLLLDQFDSSVVALRSALSDPAQGPVEAARRILAAELTGMLSWLAQQDDPVRASGTLVRFRALIQSTASLRAHQRDMTEQLVAVAAEIMAERAGLRPDDPEPQIAATALIGLWLVQYRGLRKFLDGTRTPAQIRRLVTADVERAAHLIESGLDSFLTFVHPGPSAQEAEAARTRVRRAVMKARREARAGQR